MLTKGGVGMNTYELYYNRIKNGGGKIFLEKENNLIVWENPTGTVIRVDYFENGIFKNREVFKKVG